MGRSSRVKSDDAEQLVQLLGELLELPRDVAVRRKHQGDVLSRLLDARFVAVSDIAGLRAGGEFQIVSYVLGGNPEHDYAEMARRYSEAYAAEDPVLAAVRQRRTALQVVGRPELLSNAAWKLTPIRGDLLLPAGVDEFMILQVALDDERDLSISVHRERGAAPFGRRELQLLEQVGLHCRHLYPWLYPAAPPDLQALPPRLREVLVHLLQGKTEPQIASAIRRSRHTVHDHVRRLYRRFGVTSRAELYRYFPDGIVTPPTNNQPEQADERPRRIE